MLYTKINLFHGVLTDLTKKYSKLLKDSKSKNDIEEVKIVHKVDKKEKEISSRNNDIESMFLILMN